MLILLADDDEDDRLLIWDALAQNRVPNKLKCVGDGEELLAYLRHKGAYQDAETSPRPDLILLDLNMPRMDGRDALRCIKADPDLRRIPVVVLTTSQAEEDILKTYDLGVSSFITKPIGFDRLVSMMADLGNYWFNLVSLPPQR
ncbi:response regulator [Synechococcus sp. RSCCF101]|uniref:response regulator n=1 Tax=Synechococcus sp. RSCCF101 TaxID=2511069 RepID=UPI001CD96EB5|nr:response regulator [Synechococcus sp. RSCCF101]